MKTVVVGLVLLALAVGLAFHTWQRRDRHPAADRSMVIDTSRPSPAAAPLPGQGMFPVAMDMKAAPPGPTATLKGLVLDDRKQPVPGARVIFTSLSLDDALPLDTSEPPPRPGEVRLEATTDEGDEYCFRDIAPMKGALIVKKERLLPCGMWCARLEEG